MPAAIAAVVERNTHAGRYATLGAVNLHRLADGGQQLFGKAGCVSRVAGAGHQHELVAADMRKRIVCADDCLHADGSFHQQPVADMAAEGVVDLLENVEVEKEYSQAVL